MATRVALSQRDLSWIAGVLDMKGVVVYKKNRQRATPQICLFVETKNYPVVTTLAKFTGTAPELREREVKEWMRKGCREHCPDQHVHVSEGPHGADWRWAMPAIARWTCSGAAAGVVLWNTLPLMRTDRGLGKAMDETIDQAVVGGRGWSATRSALRRLRDLGWEMPGKFKDLDLDG